MTRHKFLRLLFRDRFTDADPIKIVSVNPERLTEIIDQDESFPSNLGRVRDGEWDLNRRSFEETKFYQSIKDRICKNESWDDTPLYQNMLEPSENVIWDRKCDSVNELNERMMSIDVLIEKLEREKYMTQKELLLTNPDETKQMNNDAIHPLFNEIRVSIARDGEFLIQRQGLHRLAIAKIIGLETVGVQVAVRHSDWQETRDKIRRDGLKTVSEELRSHPDLSTVSDSISNH